MEQVSNDEGSSHSGRWNSGTEKRNGDVFVPPIPSTASGGSEVEQSLVTRVVPPVPPAKSEVWVLREGGAVVDDAAEKLPELFQDSCEWAEDFARWALAHCFFRDGCLWRVEALHDAFCGWCAARDLAPCMTATFAALLKEEGFSLATGMVEGLVLREKYLSLTAPERQAKAAPVRNGGRR